MDRTQLIATITSLIDSRPVAFIASVSEEGFPDCKAMLAPRKREGLHTFYFTTNTSSRRVAQYRANPKASIYFCDDEAFAGVLLKGTMEVCEDQLSKQMIWRDGDQEYYPGGVTDSDYCVLRFAACNARYYNNYHSDDLPIER